MHLVLALLAFSFILAGCPGSPPSPGNTTGNGTGGSVVTTNITVSPVTVTENKETLVYGSGAWNPGANNTTSGTNQTTSIPDYTLAPDKPLFIFFINLSLAQADYGNSSNERQGEAILLKKGDADILIDSGPYGTSQYLVNFLKSKGVDDIELFVVTHPRPENYGGMDAIFSNFAVEQFMWNNDTGSDSYYSSLVSAAERSARRTIFSSYLMNQTINGVNLEVLNPRDGGERFFTIDNDGIVFKITDKNFSLMTTGDIAYGAQARIATSKDFDPAVDVLQIPNYGLGQGTANIDLLLLKAAPKAAVITGSYFDPAKERYTIENKLLVKKIPYFETFSAANKTTNVVRISVENSTYSITTQ